MKTTRLLVCLAACAAATNLAFAADADKTRIEKRIVVTSGGPGDKPDKPRDPVTFLGLSVGPASGALAAQLRLAEGQGLVVNLVVPDSPAAKAGLQKHDVLVRLDEQILIEPRQLSVLVRSHKEGDKVTLTYVRAGAEAKATVTLEKHAAPEAPMHWIGEGTPMPFFEQRLFDGDGADVLHEFNVRTFDHGTAGVRVPTPPGGMAGTLRAAHAPRVTIFQPRANVVFADDAGTLEVRMDDDTRMLTAKDAKGAVIFTGPVGTPEERAALPEDLRKRLEKLESMGMGSVDHLEMRTAPRPANAPRAPTPPGVTEYAPGEPVQVMSAERAMVL